MKQGDAIPTPHKGRNNFICGYILMLSALVLGNVHAQNTAPDALVAQTTREVQGIMKQDPDLKAGKQQRVLELVEQKVLPHFDFERMTMLAVGKDWSRATPEQQKALTTAFRSLLVKTYSGALANYKDNKIDVLPVKGGSDDNTSVRSQVSVPGTGNVALDYRMHKTPAGWKVHDVSVEGVSLVTTYRSSFKTELDRSGFDGLIKLIADRAQGAERPAARAG